jgi:flagellar M-ring protein FliF
MPDFLQELLTQLKGIWARLDGGQRTTILTVMGAALVGLGGLVWYAQQPDWEVAYSSNDPSEFSEALGILQQRFDVKLQGPNVIQVKSNDIDQAKAAMALAGLQAGGGGRGDALEVSMTDPEDVRATRLWKARVAEVEQVIQQSPDVRAVQVVASRPERSIYTKTDAAIPKTATVTLAMRAGASFERTAQIAQSAVVSGLGIRMEDVTVFDRDSARRYGGDTTDGFGGGSLYDQEQARAERKRRAAQALLDTHYKDLAKVTVDVELERIVKSVTRPYESQNPAILQQTVRKSSSSDPRAAVPNGDPSAQGQSNGLASGVAVVGGSARTQKEEDSEITYATGEVHETQAGLEIRRITVALVLDKDIPKLAEAAGDEAKLKAEVAKIEELVKGAIGFDEARDSIKSYYDADIEPLPELPPLATGPSTIDQLQEWGPLVGQVLAVGFVLFMLRGLLKTAGSKGSTRTSGGGGSGSGITPQQEAQKEETPDELTRRMRREIERSIADDPAAVSRLLESWLAESVG